jgi:hypothetical protein
VDPEAGILSLLKEGQKEDQDFQDEVYKEVFQRLCKDGKTYVQFPVLSLSLTTLGHLPLPPSVLCRGYHLQAIEAACGLLQTIWPQRLLR